MRTERVDFLGVGFDRLTIDDVLARLSQVTPDTPYSYVVTPNVDHVVRLERASARSALAPLYQDAGFSLCDSRVLQRLAGLHGLALPLVPGSDLTVRMFQHIIHEGDRIAVVGGSDALLDDLANMFPFVEFVHHSPPMGLMHNAVAREEAVDFIASAKARFTFLAVGSPQQEIIASAVRNRAKATGMALCIGASLDFVTGRERRAPRVVQQLSLEWAYRLLADPRGKWRRYLIEGPRVFIMAARYKRGRAAR